MAPTVVLQRKIGAAAAVRAAGSLPFHDQPAIGETNPGEPWLRIEG